MEQERRFERGVQRTGLLRAADAFGEAPDMFERNAPDHPLAQQPAFVDDLAQPDRRQPRHAVRDVEEAVDEFGDERERIVFDLRLGRPPHERDDLREPFLDDRVEQLLAIREVVVNHRRRDAGGGGDLRDGRRGDPRSANSWIATSSMWSRRSKSSTDGRRPRGLATVDFAFMKSTLIDELVNFKEGFSPELIAIRRASKGTRVGEEAT